MNWNLLFGLFALGVGLYRIYVRCTAPEKFAKLQAMKKQWGDAAGTAVHVFGYTVVPIVIGLVLIARAL